MSTSCACLRSEEGCRVRATLTPAPPSPSEHFTIPFSSYAYALAVDALTHKGVSDPSRVAKSSCAWLVSDVLLDDFNRGPTILNEAVRDALAVVLGPKAQEEPFLQAYVCKRGDVSAGCA